MPKYRIASGPNLKEGYSVNLDAAEVFTASGRASGIVKGEEIEVVRLEQRERLEDAVRRGELIIEEIEE